MLINYDLLRTFVEAAHASSFAEAAGRRRVTKSAVSQQMSALEAQLGLPLFERVGRGVRVTADGARLAAAIEGELGAIDAALERVTAAHGEVRGEVAIGAPRPFASVWLRPRVAELLARHADLRLRVVFGVPSELEAKLVGGELDLALLVRAPESPSVDAKAVANETFSLYASKGYLERHGTPASVSDLASHRFAVFDDDLPMHAAWLRAKGGARARPTGEIVCRVASLDELLAIAAAGLAAVVLPEYFVEASREARRVVRVDLRPGRPARNALFLAWRRRAIASARFEAVRAALDGPPARASTFT